MQPGYILLSLVLGSLVLADRFAAEMEVAARRFRELSRETIQALLDRSRNKRWHSAGFWLRLCVVVIVGLLMGYAMRSPLAGLLSLGVVGFSVMLWFDIFFNLRFGMPWDYAGTTASMDGYTSGKKMAALELLGLLLSCGLWLLYVK